MYGTERDNVLPVHKTVIVQIYCIGDHGLKRLSFFRIYYTVGIDIDAFFNSPSHFFERDYLLYEIDIGSRKLAVIIKV